MDVKEPAADLKSCQMNRRETAADLRTCSPKAVETYKHGAESGTAAR